MIEYRRGLEHGERGVIEAGQLTEDRCAGHGDRRAVGGHDLEVLRIAPALAVELRQVGAIAEQLPGRCPGERPELPHLEQAGGHRAGQHGGERGGELVLPVGQQAEQRTGGGRMEHPLQARDLIGRKVVQVVHGHHRGTAPRHLLAHVAGLVQQRPPARERGRDRVLPLGRVHPDSCGPGVRDGRAHQRALADAGLPDQRDRPSARRPQATQHRQQRLDLPCPPEQLTLPGGHPPGRRTLERRSADSYSIRHDRHISPTVRQNHQPSTARHLPTCGAWRGVYHNRGDAPRPGGLPRW